MESAPKSKSPASSQKFTRAACATRPGWAGWCVTPIISGAPDELLVTQVARLLCAEAAKYQHRDRRLDSEATVETVLRLASFEPRMTAALPKGDTLFRMSAVGEGSMNLAQEVTRKLGGDWCGSDGLAPGPGHSKDRSLKIAAHNSDPDDVVLHSFAGDDWQPLRMIGVAASAHGAAQTTALRARRGRIMTHRWTLMR